VTILKTCICERRHEAASLTLLFYNMRKKSITVFCFKKSYVYFV